MASQKDAGSAATGFVTARESEPPRRCDNCEHFRRGLRESGYCDGEHIMRDPELKGRRNSQGLVKVEPDSYCWWYDAK